MFARGFSRCSVNSTNADSSSNCNQCKHARPNRGDHGGCLSHRFRARKSQIVRLGRLPRLCYGSGPASIGGLPIGPPDRFILVPHFHLGRITAGIMFPTGAGAPRSHWLGGGHRAKPLALTEAYPLQTRRGATRGTVQSLWQALYPTNSTGSTAIPLRVPRQDSWPLPEAATKALILSPWHVHPHGCRCSFAAANMRTRYCNTSAEAIERRVVTVDGHERIRRNAVQHQAPPSLKIRTTTEICRLGPFEQVRSPTTTRSQGSFCFNCHL